MPIPLPPFKAWLASNIPSVFDNTLSYYEELTKLIAYLEQVVIPAVNENELHVEQLDEAFQQLNKFVEDYFDNLDVQEEINNKLDIMTEDGTLSDIISAYLNSIAIFGYDTVADMKASDNLIAGSYAKTLGFYALGDNGGAEYKIRELADGETANEVTTLAIGESNLVAELVAKEEMNIAQFGLVGDGTTDESAKLAIALAFNGDNYLKLSFNSDKVYLAQNKIYLYSNTFIDLNGATIKSCHDGTDTSYIEFGNGLRFLNNETSTETAGYGAIANIEIANGTFDGDESGVGFFLLHAENVKVHEVTFKDCCVGTHVIDLGGCKDVEIKNCIFDGFLISNSDNKYREMIQTDYADASGMPYWEGTPSYDGLPTVFVTVDNCEFYKGDGTFYPSAVGTHSRSNDYFIENINIRNCHFEGTSYSSIRFVCARNIIIENNDFFVNAGVGIRLQTYIMTKPINNVKILNNRFVLTNNYSTAIQMTGNKQDSNVYYGEKIDIIGNTCTGDYNGSTITYDTYFVTLGDIKNIIVADNNINNCKYFILKNNNAYFKESSISDNRINYCGNYITATGTDTATYTEGSTSLNESNNIWTDDTISFNINNFKLMLSPTNDLTADQDSQSYYLVPVDTRNTAIGEFVSNANFNYRLPKCIRKFKVTAHVNAKCGSNTAYKIFRINIYDGSNNAMNGARKIFVANEEDNVGMTCVVDKGHIQQTNDQYSLGIQCYLETGDKIQAKFGASPLSYILIEGC